MTSKTANTNEKLHALTRSELRFRTLIETLPDAAAVSRAGTFVYVNPTMVSYLGMASPADLVGRPVSEVVYPDDRAALALEEAALGRSSGRRSCERRYLKKDGSLLLADVCTAAIELEGEPAVFAVLRDLTEKKQMQARLLISDRMASVGLLAAGVAHEINNPLAYIQSNVEFVMRELGRAATRIASSPLPLELRSEIEKMLREPGEALAEARHGALRIKEIVGSLKTFARADTETDGDVSLKTALDSAIDLAGNELRHRAHLQIDVQSAPTVRGNAARLSQAFLNILVNAAQAIPEGHAAQHEIGVRAYVAPDGRGVVEVRDTGRGIRPEVLPRILEPFFTTKPLGTARGLGLSVAHNIIGTLGGVIEVDTKVGAGTTFRVVFPAALQRAAIALPAGSDRSRAPARRQRVLVIDDERRVCSSVRRALADEHEVETQTDPRAALERILGGERYDAILCDVMMPQMNGSELYEELAMKLPEQARRVIFLSGGAFAPRANEVIAATSQPLLDKPFDTEGLRAAVRRMTQLHEAGGPAVTDSGARSE